MQSKNSEVVPGQIWTVKNSDHIDGCRLLILREETLEDEDVVHIAIVDPHGKTVIEHLPFAKRAILSSIEKLVSSQNSLPDYGEGYEFWRREYNNGDAGIFGAEVADCVLV